MYTNHSTFHIQKDLETWHIHANFPLQKYVKWLCSSYNDMKCLMVVVILLVINKQLTTYEFEQEEDTEEEVVFDAKKGDDVGDDDEGVVSDYESDAEMTEETILEKLDSYNIKWFSIGRVVKKW